MKIFYKYLSHSGPNKAKYFLTKIISSHSATFIVLFALCALRFRFRDFFQKQRSKKVPVVNAFLWIKYCSLSQPLRSFFRVCYDLSKKDLLTIQIFRHRKNGERPKLQFKRATDLYDFDKLPDCVLPKKSIKE